MGDEGDRGCESDEGRMGGEVCVGDVVDGDSGDGEGFGEAGD